MTPTGGTALIEHDDPDGFEWETPPDITSVIPKGFLVASGITVRRIEWYLRNRIPLAEVVTFCGSGGAGKSTTTDDFAARVTRGTMGLLPGGSDVSEPRGVVILSTEEDASAVIVPRLKAMGADTDRILIMTDDGEGDAPPLTLPSDAGRLEAAVNFMNAGLVIIDTGPSFLDQRLSSNSTEDVRAFYRPLQAIARKYRISIIVILHLNKGSGAARDRVAGSAAWIDVPRANLLMGPPPGIDVLDTPDRLVVVIKANLIGGRMPDALGVTLVPAPEDSTVGIVQWTGERAGIHASDLTDRMDSDERGAQDECVDAITDLLVNGPRPAKECEAELGAAGHSISTIRRARKSLFVTRGSKCVYQDGFRGPHMWKLPLTDDHGGPCVSVDTCGEGGHLCSTDAHAHTQMTTIQTPPPVDTRAAVEPRSPSAPGVGNEPF